MISRERLQKGLERFFGLKEFRPGQVEIITSVTNGFDTLAVMPTGGGKSICYQLPAMLMDGLTIVITPLISLMRDQVAQINRNGLVATQLDSSLELKEIQERMKLVRSDKVKLLYLAPERLGSRRFVEGLSALKISLVVVDEAHCISQWGHDFRPQYARISDFLESTGRPTVLALTATATPDVQDDIVVQLKMRSPRVYLAGFARQNLSLQVFVETGKTHSILEYVKRHPGPGIVYAATRKSVDEIHDFLSSNGAKALRYHAGLTGEERTKSQIEFLNYDRVMVATNAFGMGINKANVRYIIHYEIPGTLEAYYQEAGRGGRDGKLSECILFFHGKDVEIQKYFIETLYPTTEECTRIYNTIFDLLSIQVGEKSEEYQTVEVSETSVRTKISTGKIGSVINLLAQKKVILLVPSVSASAHIRSKVDVDSYKSAIDRTSSRDTRLVLETLLRLLGTEIFNGPQVFTLEELSHRADLDTSAVSRTLSILQRSGILEYTPPTEGISFKMLERRTERTPFDFQELSMLRDRAHQRLARMVEYARTTSCRTNFILRYFGAEEISNGCGNCDNCTVGKFFTSETSGDMPGLVEINKLILSLVKETQGRFGRSTYCKILLEGSEKIPEELCSKYSGVLSNMPPQLVYGAFDNLLSSSYLAKMSFINPTISITEDGKRYLVSGISIPRMTQFKFRKSLYKALRQEKRDIASELRIPTFAICSDEDLTGIANVRPVNEQQLSRHLPENVSKSTLRRLLQVCLDFSPAESVELPENERQVYELYLEKLTASEIASFLQVSIQNIIDVLEAISREGRKIDFRTLIEQKKFNRIGSELANNSDVVAVHKVLPEAELAEVLLVSRILSASI